MCVDWCVFMELLSEVCLLQLWVCGMLGIKLNPAADSADEIWHIAYCAQETRWIDKDVYFAHLFL